MRAPSISGDTAVNLAIIGAALVAVAYLVQKLSGAGSVVYDSAVAAADAVNPLSQTNAVYSGVNALGHKIATNVGPDAPGMNADDSWTLGGFVYDVTHDGTFNPASTNNAVYRSVNSVGGAIVSSPTGAGKNADGSWSLGGWLYDVTH